MKRPPPTKDDVIAVLRQIAEESGDGRVSIKEFEEKTRWTIHWINKFWPIGGYKEACEKAGVKPGPIMGVEKNQRLTDEEVAIKFIDVVGKVDRIPSLGRFVAIARVSQHTILRGGKYPAAKTRLIREYFNWPANKRGNERVEQILGDELNKLNPLVGTTAQLSAGATSAGPAPIGQVPERYISDVHALRDRGEEEKRQLVVRFFCEVLGYKRTRVKSEHEKNDVRVDDRRNQPWLVVEVKARMETGKEKRAARRQGFDYAHRSGMRFVLISDGNFYEVFDRCAGQFLRYDEMSRGSFVLTALLPRDKDLLGILASER